LEENLYPRLPPLLKIEFFAIGQNCPILSQNVPKFELYKHNDELFNMYYVIFYAFCGTDIMAGAQIRYIHLLSLSRRIS
jgi:hypothetical protein